jgi:hypothetical protein
MPTDIIFSVIETRRVALARWNEANANGDYGDIWCDTACRTLDALEATPCATPEGLMAKYTQLVADVSDEFTSADEVVEALLQDLEYLVVSPVFSKIRKAKMLRLSRELEERR